MKRRKLAVGLETMSMKNRPRPETGSQPSPGIGTGVIWDQAAYESTVIPAQLVLAKAGSGNPMLGVRISRGLETGFPPAREWRHARRS